MPENMVALLRSETGRILVYEKCKEMNLDIDIFQRLIDAELKQVGKIRKRGLRAEFDEIFGEIEGMEE